MEPISLVLSAISVNCNNTQSKACNDTCTCFIHIAMIPHHRHHTKIICYDFYKPGPGIVVLLGLFVLKIRDKTALQFANVAVKEHTGWLVVVDH